MGKCFVIQPFDKGAYDKRYEDVLVPAITAAGLEDYRVDRDPTVSMPIESISDGIRQCDACIADITTDNPNVWFELGFALACGKPLVMICDSKSRTGAYPFDVQHRTVVSYLPESPRDFSELQKTITLRLKALLARANNTQTMAFIESSAKISGLSPHELAALQIVGENQISSSATVLAAEIQDEMVQAGFTKIASTLALRLLERRAFVEQIQEFDNFGNPYWTYRITEAATNWMLDNQQEFQLTIGRGRTQDNAGTRRAPGDVITEDDVPF